MIILGIVLLVFVIMAFIIRRGSLSGGLEFTILKADELLRTNLEAGQIPIYILPDNPSLKVKKQLENQGIVVYNKEAAENILNNLRRVMKTKNKQKKYKYIISGCAGMCKERLHELMLSNNFLYAPVGEKHSLAYVRAELINGEFNNIATTTPCNLINILPGKPYRVHLGKDVLSKRFEAASFVPTTWNYLEFLRFDFPAGVYIFKPVSALGSSGFGIEIENIKRGDIKQVKEIVKRIQTLELNTRANSINKTLCNISVSKYINNPLLYPDGNRKFHLRCYFSAKIKTNLNVKEFTEMNQNSFINKKNFTWEYTYSPFFVIVTAKDPYQKADYHNKYIHDTHMKSTPWFKMLSEGFPSNQCKKMKKGIHIVMKKLRDVFVKNNIATKYKSYKDGYQISGIDIMFDDDYNPWLIEVNPTAGYGVSYPDCVKFEDDFLTWEYHNLIEPSIDKSIKINNVDFKPLLFDFPGYSITNDVFITLPNNVSECIRMLSKINVFERERFWIAVSNNVDSVAKMYNWEFVAEKNGIKWYLHDVLV